MAKKALKAQLYDKPRYAFDEEQLFHHFDNDKEREEFETKTFPWWKPVWTDDQSWVIPTYSWYFKNPEGKFFRFSDFDEAYQGYFPEFDRNLSKAASYENSPVFFVTWMRKVVYDRSIYLWNQKEKEFKAEFPNKRPDQIARMCDDEVAKFFLNLKG